MNPNVTAAAAYLDGLKPDWWQHIDPLTLDLADSRACICGQNGLSWKKTFCPNGVATPFSLASCMRRDEPFWLEEIAKRLSAKVKADRELALA